MYSEGDLRRDATCWDVRSTSYTERYQDTHMWLKKYRPTLENCKDAGPSHNLNYNNNKRIYRYAETLLNAAELLLQTGGSMSEAVGYVNEVRTRAGLASLNGVTIDDILTERHLEFCGEGKRYFDLVRTGRAASVLTPANDGGGFRTKSWSEAVRYLPIPQDNIDAAQGTLKQNGNY